MTTAEMELASLKDYVNTWLRECHCDSKQVGLSDDVRRGIDALVFAFRTREQTAQRLCEIYWNIAAKYVSEDEIRRIRDEEIAKL